MSVRLTIVFFITWLGVCLISSSSSAQQSLTDGVLINADQMDRDLVKQTVRLSGHVQLVFQGQHLSCDRAEINLKTHSIVAEGSVVLKNERVHVEGDRVVFNYKQNTGYIYNGFVQSGQVIFEGQLIEKIGENRYLATEARYTACDTCPPGWSFSGRNIDAEIGGYARIKRPVFRVAGVPILILPGLVVPLKSARQSGVLVPTWTRSRKGGLEISESYFWAINRSQDLTLTGRWYEFRGYMLLNDYRYVLAEGSKGRLRNAWIRDRQPRNESAYQLNKNLDRWFVNYDHIYRMPNDLVHRADITQISDLRYPRDFPDDVEGHGDPSLENKTSISQSGDDHYWSAEVDAYTNLLKSYPLSDNSDSVHRFPELRYASKERQLFEHGPYYSFALDYVNFARDQYSYDDLSLVSGKRVAQVGPQGEIQRDGKFDPATDLIRTGQRLDLKPTLSYPFQIARRFDILPSVTYRETQYRFYPTPSAESAGYGQTAARRFLLTELRARTEFTRIYGDLQDPKSHRIKHSIEPELGYSEIPWARRPSHPFFGEFEGIQHSRQYDPVSDADINNPNTKLQFDYEDRTFKRKVVDFSLTNRLTRKYWLNEEARYKTMALFRLSQSYDFNEANSTTPHPWSSIHSLLDLRFDHFETLTTAAYNPYAKVTNISSRVRTMLTPKNFVQVSYTRNFILNDNYNVNSETRNLGFAAGFVSPYLDLLGQVDISALTNKINSWEYQIDFKPPGRCWVITIKHKQILGGDPRIGGALQFNFGGEDDRVRAAKNDSIKSEKPSTRQ